MTTELIAFSERPDLREPVMVVMLSGWIDASTAAASAMATLDSELGARTIGLFDRDTFIDYRARRPTMEIREGLNSRLVWADIELKTGRDRAGRDVLLLAGHEPDAAWNGFISCVATIAADFGVTTSVGLGAYPIATPHTRPSRLSCTTPSREVLERLPYLKNSVDVPAGMQAALEHGLVAKGVTAYGLWAQVPHYVSQMSYPAASVALLDGLREMTGIDVDTSAIRTEAVLQRSRLDDLVAGNDEHVAMVRQLEQIYDATAGSAPAPVPAPDAGPIDSEGLPSADELAAELEQFLREQG